MRNDNSKISYDSEVDILLLELPGNEKIDYATEMGNFVVHYTKKDKPVLIEVLNASKIFQGNPNSLKDIATIAFA